MLETILTILEISFIAVLGALGIWFAHKRELPVLSWSWLFMISNLKVVQSTYVWLIILPVADRFLSDLNEKLDFSAYVDGLVLDATLPFSWQLLFMSALLFTLANVLAFVLCPSFIRQFKNYREYSDKGFDYRYVHEAARAVALPNLQETNLTRLENARFTSKHETVEIETQKLFLQLHKKLDQERPAARLVCLALYIYGGWSLLLIILINCWYALSSLTFPIIH